MAAKKLILFCYDHFKKFRGVKPSAFFYVLYLGMTLDYKKNAKNFNCEKCDFICSKKSDYDRHLFTLKHKMDDAGLQENADVEYTCNCGKNYKYRQGLWKHKKKCSLLNQSQEMIEKEEDSKQDMHLLTGLIMEMMKSNQELQKSLIEVCKNSNSVTTNNQISNSMVNSNNKTFNLQFFLNETCKDAMNITDFVNSLQLQLTDLEGVGKNGFVEGISNIIVNNLKAMDVTKRPVHCSDQKREVMYVKDEDQWFNDSKEEPNNQKLKKAINQIAHKNICMIPEWKAKYPDCIFSDSKKSDQYNHIIYEAMSQNDENAEKIIKNIAKNVIIEK